MRVTGLLELCFCKKFWMHPLNFTLDRNVSISPKMIYILHFLQGLTKMRSHLIPCMLHPQTHLGVISCNFPYPWAERG